MSDYLFDSDILIDHLRGAHRVEELINELTESESTKRSFYISVVTIGEIFSGQSMKLPSHVGIATQLINSFLNIDIDASIAQKAGALRRIHGISLVDSFIAASAFAKHLTLVTRNQRHFSKVFGLKLITPTSRRGTT